MRFRSTVAGHITQILWWKIQNSGTRTAQIYDTTPTLLFSQVFTGETAYGWQTMTLGTPLAISAATDYVACVYDDTGYYAFVAGFFPYGPFPLSTPLSAPEDRYNSGGGPSYPGNVFTPDAYGACDIVFDDGGAFVVPTVQGKSDIQPAASGWMKALVLDQVPLIVGVEEWDTDGSPNPPCLVIKQPGYKRFRWAVQAGSRSVSVRVKQVANLVPRPTLVIKANPLVGLNADVTATSPGGTGWVTIGPASFTATAAGVVLVELWNNLNTVYSAVNANLTGNPAEPAFFDHRIVT